MAEPEPYRPPDPVPGSRVWALVERYRGSFEVPPISYGTVGDLADSSGEMPELVSANGDMKDLQRCWAVKAVLGRVEPGGRLLEIGAGEPLVAAVLSRLGYRVTIVDPYDGSGNGPRDYDDYRAFYTDLDFVRDRFPPSTDLEPGFAAIYSVSVLEHIPIPAVGAVTDEVGRLLAPSGVSIHAVDHVLAGWGAGEHLRRLERIVAGLGLPEGALEDTIARLEADPEAYFVSAEAHERWRGDVPYEDYPMRRIASINLCA